MRIHNYVSFLNVFYIFYKMLLTEFLKSDFQVSFVFEYTSEKSWIKDFLEIIILDIIPRKVTQFLDDSIFSPR